MKLYRRMGAAEAMSILADGFRDAEGGYLLDSDLPLRRGVWLSDVPLDINEGAKGNQLLEIEIPEQRIKRWEWIEEGKPYREFLIPAKVVNRYGPAIIIEV